MKNAQDRNDWNTTGLDLSVVQLWSSGNNESVSELAPAGVVINANLGYGINGNTDDEEAPKGQVVLTTRLAYDVIADTKGGSTARRDEKALALRGRYGTRQFNASIEAAYSENNYAGALDQSQWTYTLAAEYQISDGFWLVGSVADQSGDAVAGNDTKATATFRWALSDKATLE